MLGVYFEQEQQVAPLAARILAMLILQGNRGTTFEQMVTDLEASKSTICTHLNSLIDQKRIGYFTKCGDRKRYFSMAPGYISRKIEGLATQWNREIILQQQILAYKKAFNKENPEEPLSLTVQEDVLEFLSRAIASLEELAPKYQNKEKQHNSDIL